MSCKKEELERGDKLEDMLFEVPRAADSACITEGQNGHCDGQGRCVLDEGIEDDDDLPGDYP